MKMGKFWNESNQRNGTYDGISGAGSAPPAGRPPGTGGAAPPGRFGIDGAGRVPAGGGGGWRAPPPWLPMELCWDLYEI